MPPLATRDYVSRVFTRSVSSDLITLTSLQQALSDGLLAFSPLALLVGTDSVRALSQSCTNAKQVFVSSLAPIGTLSTIATVSKAANLPGLKDLLGTGDNGAI
jgi:hypothetical protein